jgi:hypothetical protein
MGKKKLTKENQQIKLSLNGLPEGEFDIDNLMESLRMEYRNNNSGAGQFNLQDNPLVIVFVKEFPSSVE